MILGTPILGNHNDKDWIKHTESQAGIHVPFVETIQR